VPYDLHAWEGGAGGCCPAAPRERSAIKGGVERAVSEEPIRKKIVLDLDVFEIPALPKPVRVHIMPGAMTIDLEPGESIFDAAKRKGIAIPTVCGGKGTCGTCRVRFTLPAREPTILERQFIDRADLALGVRLACRSRPEGDVAVTILPERRRSRR